MTSEPYDASALLDEIHEGGKTFTLKGETFTLPPPSAWPDAVIDAARNEDLPGVGRGLLGADYDRFVSVGGTSILLQKIHTELFGDASPGESSASSSS